MLELKTMNKPTDTIEEMTGLSELITAKVKTTDSTR